MNSTDKVVIPSNIARALDKLKSLHPEQMQYLTWTMDWLITHGYNLAAKWIQANLGLYQECLRQGWTTEVKNCRYPIKSPMLVSQATLRS